MKARKFYDTIIEAHGSERLDMAAMFIELAGDRYIYEVLLPDWDIRISLPYPRDLVDGWIKHAGGGDHRTWKPGVPDVFTYVLAKLDRQPASVQAYVRGRFGPMLEEMQAYAKETWKEIEEFDLAKWAAGQGQP